MMHAVDPSNIRLIEHCRQAVRIRAAALIGRCLDAARASLDDAVRDHRPAAFRQGARDALDVLDRHGAGIRESFPAVLDQAIADAVAGVIGEKAAGVTAQEITRGDDPGALPDQAALALLDDSALAHFVEAAQLEQAVQPVVEGTLARLDSLMSSALAQPVVRPDLNPLRPEVLCQALMQVLDQQSGSTEVRRRWLRHFARSYAGELDGLYAAVADLFAQQGVEEARYQIRLTESGAGPIVLAADGAFPMLGGALAPEEDLSDEEVIRRRRAPAPFLVTAWPDEQARERMAMERKTQTVRASQVLGIDAVRALMALVADDARILAPVRQILAALEPALLRLALDEPDFLGDEEHPARRFVEEAAQRSFKFSDESSAGFNGFIVPVRAAIGQIDALAQPSGRDFGQRLQALQASWQARDEAEKQACASGQRMLEFAQKRQALADAIALDFSRRSDLEGVPAVVADFLLRDWSLVIAHAQLADNVQRANGGSRLDPGGYLSIVTDLLWSVRRDEILRDFARLFDVVPRVAPTLRRGLEMLGKGPRESQALFDMLLRFHGPALRLRRARRALDQALAPEELAAALPPAGADPVKPGQWPSPQAAAQPWIGRRERETVGFMDSEMGTLPIMLSARADAMPAWTTTAAPGQEEEDADARVRIQLDQLRPGDRVDLYRQQAWRRIQLVWLGESGALYLFVGHGGRVCSMARPTLENLLRARRARLVEMGAVVARALDTLAAAPPTVN